MPLIPEAASVAGAAALGFGGFLYAGLYPTSQIFGQTLVAGSDPKELALTFDDGPGERFTQEILEYLANYRARATFFMMGEHVRAMPWLAREVVAAGHLVGNHTMTHPNLLWTPAARVRTELSDTTKLMEDTLGVEVKYFRPPYGGRRPVVLRAARELGLNPVLWNCTGRDWSETSPERIVKNLTRAIRRNVKAGRGSNLLLHDGSPESLTPNRAWTSTAVAILLDRMKREGFRFVTVDGWA